MPHRNDDWITRRFRDLERRVDELQPSILNSILPLFQSLQAQQTQLGDALQQLSDQEAELEAQQALLVRPASNVASTSGWPLTTTETTRGTATINVPDGFNSAIVIVQAAASAFLSGSALDYFYLTGNIAVSSIGYSGNWVASAVSGQGNAGTSPAAGSAYPSQQYATNYVFTGLNGGTITATYAVHAQGNNWAAQTSNGGWVNLFCVFYNT
jgi:hypothetical protein